MDKQTVVDPYNELLLSNKKALTIDTHKITSEFQNSFAEWKQPEKNKLDAAWSLHWRHLKIQTYL